MPQCDVQRFPSFSDFAAFAEHYKVARGRMPRRGEGRSHAIGLRLALDLKKRAARSCLDIAIRHYEKAAMEFAREIRAADLYEFCERANKQFDLDWLIGFSHAWRNWERTDVKSLRSRGVLDQRLFDGRHPRATEYHRGIYELARLQRDFVRRAAGAIFAKPANSLLDLGSGLAAQARLLLAEKRVKQATCIDHPIVTDIGRTEAPEIRWEGGDLRTISTTNLPEHDVVWIGNVMHHYSVNDIERILARFAGCLKCNGRIVVQEYLAGEPGAYGLVAGIFGIHFSLTTDHSRTFTLPEITAFLRGAFGDVCLAQRFDGRFSSLLVYRIQCRS